MKNRIIGLAVALATLSASVAVADQRCRSVDFFFENGNDAAPIRVTKINYQDLEDGKWRTNDVSNEDVAASATSGRVNETLEYVGNEAIPAMQVQYRLCEEPRSDGTCRRRDWSGRIWSNTIAVDIERCIRNMNVNLLVEGDVDREN